MKLNRFELIYFVRSYILGKKIYGYLQEKLKYLFNFRNQYSKFEPVSLFSKKTYVFMIDGKTRHGGLSDRLRGLMSVYSYCKDKGYDFRVCWLYPFKLNDYLEPANYNWVVESNQLSFNTKNTEFIFVNSYNDVNNDISNYYYMLDNNKIESHVYSNVTINENLYKIYFKELFSLNPRLQAAVENCCKEINDSFISITFRFIGLLGDFNDDPRWGACEIEEREVYVQKSCHAIEKIKAMNPSIKKILVTADSPSFLNKVKKEFSYVYVIPGTVVHMDNTVDDDYNLHLKSFVDFIMISKSEKCFTYQTGKMFGDSKFAKTAALIGGKNVIELTDEKLMNMTL